MKKEKVKVIGIKDYIYVVVMFLLVGLLVFGLRTLYRTYEEYELKTPVISGKIQEIDKNSFNDYLIEHDDFYLYVGIAKDENCRELEKDLVKFLNRKNIKGDTVYLNMSNFKLRDVQNTLKSIGFDFKDAEYPMFLIVNDKKIVHSVYKKDRNINIGDIEKIFDENEIGD